MGGPLWTKEEREYFIKEIIPLSQYATGSFTSHKRTFGELAPIMQAELDDRGVSKRRYTAKNLFQQYRQRFGRSGLLKESTVGGGKPTGETMSEVLPAPNDSSAEKFPTVSVKSDFPVERADLGEISYSDACTQTEIQPEPVRAARIPSKRRRTMDNGSPSHAGACLDEHDSHARMRRHAAFRRPSLNLSLPPPKMNSFENINIPDSSCSSNCNNQYSSSSAGRDEVICESRGPATAIFRIHRRHTVEAKLQQASGPFDSFTNALPKEYKVISQPATQLPDPFVPLKSATGADLTLITLPAPSTRAPIDRLLDYFSDPSTLEGLPDFGPTAEACGERLKTGEGSEGTSDIESLSAASRRNRVLEIVRARAKQIED